MFPSVVCVGKGEEEAGLGPRMELRQREAADTPRDGAANALATEEESDEFDDDSSSFAGPKWEHVILPVTFRLGKLRKGLDRKDAQEIAELEDEGFELVAATSTAYEVYTVFFKRQRQRLNGEP
jgi:hypothetical protein